jgi:hypothetical protein
LGNKKFFVLILECYHHLKLSWQEKRQNFEYVRQKHANPPAFSFTLVIELNEKWVNPKEDR